MPPKPREKNFITEEVCDAVLKSSPEELSNLEFGELSEEELIDEGVDPELSVKLERYFSPLIL